MIGLPFGLLAGAVIQIAQCINLSPFHSNAGHSEAGMRVNRAGQIQENVGGPWTTIINYVSSGLPDATVGDRFEIKMEFVSGDALTGSNSGLGVWLAISATRTWTMDDTPGEFRIGNFTYEIREIAVPSNISSVCTFVPETEDGS